jgi:hypothetical protein
MLFLTGSLNMQEVFSETIVNRMVNTEFQKYKKQAQISPYWPKIINNNTQMNRRQQDSPCWILGPWLWSPPWKAVEISNRNSQIRKDEELGQRRRARERSKQFDGEVKRVLTEYRTE